MKIRLTEDMILWLGHDPNRVDRLKSIIQALKAKGKPPPVADIHYKSYLEMCFLGNMRLDEVADTLRIGVLSKKEDE